MPTTLADNILILNDLPDPKRENRILIGSTYKIETIAEYLLRIPQDIREPEMVVTIFSPAGTFAMSDKATAMASRTSTKYKFGILPTDDSFIEDTSLYDAINIASENIISTASSDASNKANQAKEDAISAASRALSTAIPTAKSEVKNEVISYYNTLKKKLSAKWYTLGSSTSTNTGGYLYQDYVQQYFEFTGFTNLAQGGTTLSYYIGKISTWVNIPDIVTIMSGSNDWANSTALGTLSDFINDTYSTTPTFYGAWRKVINELYSKAPSVLCYLATSYSRSLVVGIGSPNVTNSLGLYMYHYNDAIREVSKFAGIPLIDVERDSNVNMFNISTLDIDDLTHVAETGKRRIGQVFIDKLIATIPANMYVTSTVSSSEKDITSFSIAGVSGIISGTSISLSLPSGTSLTNLTPSITTSVGSIVSPNSGVVTDFTNPVQYTVTAQDGSTKIYTVTVAIASSSAKDILSFILDGVTGSISGTIISVTVPFGTDVTSIAPTISISGGATISPSASTPQNFTNPVQYTVTAQDSTTKVYTVTVTIAPESGGYGPNVFDVNTMVLNNQLYNTTNGAALPSTVNTGRSMAFPIPVESGATYTVDAPNGGTNMVIGNGVLFYDSSAGLAANYKGAYKPSTNSYSTVYSSSVVDFNVTTVTTFDITIPSGVTHILLLTRRDGTFVSYANYLRVRKII